MKQWFERKSRAKGYALTLVAVVLGIALWLFIWRMGYIAAIVSFAIAYGVFRFFKLGAGDLTKRDLPYLCLIILVTVIISFYSGIIYEIWRQYSGILGGSDGFFSASFWSTASNVIKNFASYARDFWTVIIFTVLAIASLLVDFRRQQKIVASN